MKLALMIVGSLLTAASLGSAFAKLTKAPPVMESMASVGIKKNQIPILALIEIAGGAGLVLGIWSKPLGVVSVICLSLFFFGAVFSHLRKKHAISIFAPALVLFFIAFSVLVLEIRR